MTEEESVVCRWPGLASVPHKITSPATARYNCIAWAAGDSENWWEPDPYHMSRCYWPPGVPEEWTMAAWIAVFEGLGYRRVEEVTEEAARVADIALFADPEGMPKHAARRGADGLWLSKLGKFVDIVHELKGLTGERYGRVAVLLAAGSGGATK